MKTSLYEIIYLLKICICTDIYIFCTQFQINGESVVNATHEHTVQLIKRSGDTLAMKVVTVKPLSAEGMDVHMDGTRTLPIKKKGKPNSA